MEREPGRGVGLREVDRGVAWSFSLRVDRDVPVSVGRSRCELQSIPASEKSLDTPFIEATQALKRQADPSTTFS